MASSFQSRRLDITFSLAAGTFKGEADTVKLSGMKADAEIHMAGGSQLAEAKIRVFGLSQALMNRLTVLAWQAVDIHKNTVRIAAGTNDKDMATVFYGDIWNAMADYQGAPDVPLIVSAQSGFVNKLKAENPKTYPGTQSVATIMAQLAKLLGVPFENNGVTSTVTDQYLSGTLLDQAHALARTANIDIYYDQTILAISPKGRARKGDAVLVNASTGLVGFPSLDRIGVAFTTLYNQSISHGKKVKIETSVTPANGEFYVYAMTHALSSETPGGPWFTHCIASTQANAIR